MRSALDRIVMGALLVASAVLLFSIRRHGLIFNDEGWALYPAARMLEGERLYQELYTYYAPLPYHVLEFVFWLTGPSLLWARTLWIGYLLTSIAASYRVARRFAPPAIAWLPAAVYALAPGPWHKSFYGLCSALFFLALARALERASSGRLLLLGGVAGATLMTRQELGVTQLGVAMGLLGIAPLWPLGRQSLRRTALVAAANRILRVGIGFAVAVAAVLELHNRRGNLPDLLHAVFGQAAAYSNRSFEALLRFLSPGTFADALEGREIGFVLLVPLLLVPVAVGFVVRAVWARGLDPTHSLAAALVAFSLPAIAQSYNPPLLVRFLQSGICFYLLVPFVVAEISGRLRRPVTVLACLAFSGWVGFILISPHTTHPSEAYGGSIRSLKYQTPVQVLGARFFTTPDIADEVRLVRAFVARKTGPQDPVFVAPLHSLYYLLLERRNATAFLSDFPFANVAMSKERKGIEMMRLLASETAYAIVDRKWWLNPHRRSSPIWNTLIREFTAVRHYGSMMILEREPGRERRSLQAAAQRIGARHAKPGDLEALREIAGAWPDEPLPHELLGELYLQQGRAGEAVVAFSNAERRDPRNPRLQRRKQAALRRLGERP